MGKTKVQKSGTKVAAATAEAPALRRPRRIRAPHRKFLRRQDKRYRERAKLPNAFKVSKAAALVLWQNKTLFIAIALIYGILNIILVRGLAGSVDVGSLRDQLNQAFNGHLGHFAANLTVFAVLIGSSGNGTSTDAGAWQLFLILIMSLVVIWSLRQRLAGTEIRVRDGFYHGVYPLIPFVLVLIVIGIQLLPLVIGASLYSIIISGGIAVTAIEKIACLLILILLAAWSFYMVCSSVFALYIVTLPDMTPMKALRSARELVRYRRWTILRKILYLPIVLLIIAALIVVPIIIVAAPAAQWVVFALSMIAIIVVHAYMYTLYRELL